MGMQGWNTNDANDPVPGQGTYGVNEQGKAYGSGELTPDMIKGMKFPMRGDGYDPAEVHEFLHQVASAFDVLSSTDLAQAMRAELQRNGEISSRVVLAGHETAERLRLQAAGDARTIIEDTKRLAEQLRDASRQEVDRTRQQVDEMRHSFVEELREIYDRIGASLYRFEHATRAAQADAAAQGGAGHPSYQVPVQPEAPASGEPPWGEPARADDDHEPATGLPPAYTLIEQVGHEERSPYDSVTVDEDEPLVDLRGFLDEADDAPTGQPDTDPFAPPPAHPDPVAEPDLIAEPDNEPVAEPEPIPDTDPGSEPEPVAEPEPEPEPIAAAAERPAQSAAAGRWQVTDDGELVVDEEPSAPPEATPEPAVAPDAPADDERAEALIAGLDQVLSQQTPEPAPLPEPPSLQPDNGQVPEPAALQQFVLESLQSGHPREAVEAYLRDTFGIADPAPVVDMALAAGTQPPA